MIKIYSIKEIVEASNNILNRTKINSKLSYNKKNKKIFFKKEKPLILSEEVLVNKKIHVPVTQNLVKKNKNKKIISKNNQNTLIDQLYLKFNKKIKKNTLKLIFELQKEVSDLNQNNDFINKLNIKLKIQINNLTSDLKKLNNQNKKIIKEKNVSSEKISKINKKLIESEKLIYNINQSKIKLENEIKGKEILNDKVNKLSKELIDAKEKIEILEKNKTKLEKEVLELKSQNEINKQKIYDVSQVENKNKFYQEENLRIGSELLEIKKMYDITKKEIEKYENQKINLISKIDSVNEVLKDNNILTNIFNNNLEQKEIKIQDRNKQPDKDNLTLSNKIKDIFGKN